MWGSGSGMGKEWKAALFPRPTSLSATKHTFSSNARVLAIQVGSEFPLPSGVERLINQLLGRPGQNSLAPAYKNAKARTIQGERE